MTGRRTAFLCAVVIAVIGVSLGTWFTTRSASPDKPRPAASIPLRPLPPHVEYPIPDGWTATHVPSTFTLGSKSGDILSITAAAGACQRSHVELVPRRGGRVEVLAWNRRLTTDLPNAGCTGEMSVGEYRFRLPTDLQDAKFEAIGCAATAGSDEVACKEVVKAAER
jgi:hypothetical protein